MIVYILPVALFVVTLIIILALRAEDKKSRSLQIVKDRIDLLCESGLVEERLDRDGRMVMKYSMSPKGRFVGNLLLIVDMAMKDRFDYEGSELCRCLESECAKLLNEDEDTSERRH